MVTIEKTGEGRCCLSGKQCQGVYATFGDGSFQHVFLSWRSLQQLVKLKCGQVGASQLVGERK